MAPGFAGNGISATTHTAYPGRRATLRIAVSRRRHVPGPASGRALLVGRGARRLRAVAGGQGVCLAPRCLGCACALAGATSRLARARCRRGVGRIAAGRAARRTAGGAAVPVGRDAACLTSVSDMRGVVGGHTAALEWLVDVDLLAQSGNA
ncbi:hypothetical protein G6F64_014685 [Rhizopus arrhizus]|uniref:Uncharacterized protein n=1 Tax=Rhizopus oryzae TaxID=64495 RepID=A0A9P6WT41_RHIOR|nr:hypothetical protein G6F64_014685 [Rhizopus arrhizus]